MIQTENLSHPFITGTEFNYYHICLKKMLEEKDNY
jgi:hypothetical protein